MSDETAWVYAGRKRRTGRLGLAWHVLRGRPLIYRTNFTGTIRLGHNEHLAVVDVHIAERPGIVIACVPAGRTAPTQTGDR